MSILFSDIRRFTNIAEKIGARETVSMLNEYFLEMVEIIFAHHGILDRYIGDAIMSVFGTPLVRPDDADNAVTVANGMMAALARLNQKRQESNQEPVVVGIGINTGEVVAGNIGSPRCMDYTVIGDGVNLAARLEGATKFYSTSILLSEFTARRLTRPHRLREIDLIRVKGKDQPVAIYDSLDYHTPETFPHLDKALETFAKGLVAYRRRDWLASVRAFAAALELNPNDGPTQLYLERSLHYRQAPPSEGWDGVWMLTEK